MSAEAHQRHDPKFIGAVVGGVLLVLGSGAGGYVARGPAEKAAAAVEHAVAPERVENLERWRAAREALDVRDREERESRETRDREERGKIAAALQDLSKTNASLRDAVLVVTERQGAMERTVESRLRALEQAVPTRIAPKR